MSRGHFIICANGHALPDGLNLTRMREVGWQPLAPPKCGGGRTPLGHIGNDTDLQGAAVYLASDASRHVTGQYIAVDGGASIA
jgi:NAD(P)-dependent dehydrogenase (short-subunit alcohol dehydrogenase family)